MKRLVLIALLSILTYQAEAQYHSIWKGAQIDSGITKIRYSAINAKADFGAIGNGAADDRVAIQAAITSLASTGGTVFIPKGTYLMSLTSHPQSSGTKTCLVIPSNVTLEGEGKGKTILKISGVAPHNSRVLINANILVTSNADSNIVIRNLTTNSNGTAASLSADESQQGISLIGVKNCLIENVVVDDVRGTASGGAGESFSLEINQSNSVTMINVECIGRSYSSSGFSANASLGVSWIGCRAHDFKYIGFTHWDSRNLTYSDCWAWNNAEYAGFNSENSANVLYVNCIAGGRSTSYDNYFYDAFSSLGNYHGFVVGGADHNGLVSFSNCIAQYNASNGIEGSGNADISVIGGSYRKNGGYGIAFHNTTDTVMRKIDGQPALDSNTVAPLMWRGVSNTHYPNAGAFFLGNPPVTNSVLTSDDAGVGTWQTYPPSTTFTLASGAGWYRFVSQAAYYAGQVRIYGLTDNNIYTDIVFNVSQSGYSGASSINIIKNLNYNDNHIDSIRTGYLGGGVAVLDIKFKSINTPSTVSLSASEYITLATSTSINPTAPTIGTAVPGYMMGSFIANVYPFRNGISPNLVINGTAADSTLTVLGSMRISSNANIGGTVTLPNANTVTGAANNISFSKGLSVSGATYDSSVTGTGGHFARGLLVGGSAEIVDDVKWTFRHAFLRYDTTAYVPAVAQNVYTTLTPGFTTIDNDSITVAADTITILTPGDYYSLATFSVSGGNNDNFVFALYKNGVIVNRKLVTTRGAGNDIPVSMQNYIVGATRNTGLSLRVTNTTDNDDPTLNGIAWYLEKKPER
jgi:hypothetical protein